MRVLLIAGAAQLEVMASINRYTLSCDTIDRYESNSPMPLTSDASITSPPERISRLQVIALLVCIVAFAFDLFEISMGSVLSAVFSAPPHQIPAPDLAWLLSSVYIGAIIGAPTCGWLADRYGRRLVLAGCLAWLSLASLGAAYSAQALPLGIFRGLSGVALGAFPPLMVAYLAEIMPASRRGMLLFIVSALAFLGPPLGIFLIRVTAPLQPLGMESWRWAFVAGSLGAAITAVFFLWLPESPRWLREGQQGQSPGRRSDASASRWAASPTAIRLCSRVSDGPSTYQTTDWKTPRSRHGVRLALVYSLNFLSPWFSVGFILVSGALLVQKGFQLSDTLLYIAVSTMGPTIGSLIASTVVDHVPRRLVLAVCAATMLVAGAIFSVSQTLLPLAAASLLFSICFALYVPALNLYVADLFATRVRAWAIATAWTFNRVGAALLPFVLLPVLKSAGPVAMFSIIAAALVATLALLKFDPI